MKLRDRFLDAITAVNSTLLHRTSSLDAITAVGSAQLPPPRPSPPSSLLESLRDRGGAPPFRLLPPSRFLDAIVAVGSRTRCSMYGPLAPLCFAV